MISVNVGDSVKVGKLNFHCTGIACPEEYDVFVGEDIVGYVNIRWERILVKDPSLNETWLEASLLTDIEDSNRKEILTIAAIAVLSNI